MEDMEIPQLDKPLALLDKPLVNNETDSKEPIPRNRKGSVIAGNSVGNNSIVSIASSINFNTSTPRFLSSTKFENSSLHKKLKSPLKSNKLIDRTKMNKKNTTTYLPSLNKQKSLRRSLSAEQFNSTKGLQRTNSEKSLLQAKHTQSTGNLSNIQNGLHHAEISPIAEGSRETSLIFKTPSAYERRSIALFTPRSAASQRRSIYRPTTPLPSLNDLQKRLNEWLVKRGKSISLMHNLKCFETPEQITEENKENIEVNENLDKGSYEDLRIITNGNHSDKVTHEIIDGRNLENIAKAALMDLQNLIQEGYPISHCESWLQLIRSKYEKLQEEPEYWECRAAIEEARGNISNAVECYKTAIVHGAEVREVDKSLDILLQKFSLLNISPKHTETEKNSKERARIIQDARNVFKSSIIKFAVQEKKLKKNGNELQLIATPVRRSTRLSRSAYTSTPGIKICSSLKHLDSPDRAKVDFVQNKALN